MSPKSAPSSLPLRAFHRRVGFGALALIVVIYLLAFVPQLHDAILQFEAWLFRLLNGRLGHNPMLDLTTMVLASDFHLNVTLVVIIVMSLHGAWLRRNSDFGQLFGLIAFTAVAAVLVDEAADLVSDHLRRDLPWNEGSLERMFELYNVEFLSIPSRGGLIDENVCHLAFVMLMLHRRLPRVQLVGGIMLALHVVSQLAVGAQWLMDEIISLLTGAMVAGLTMHFGWRLVARTERKVSDLFLLVAWQSIDRIPAALARRSGAPSFMKRLRTVKRGLSRRRDIFWHLIITRQVLPLLDADETTASWDGAPPERFRRGFRPSPLVRFVTVAGGEVFVVRAVEIAGGVFWTTPRFRRYRDAAKCNLVLSRLGLPVPRVYWVHHGYGWGGLTHRHLFIEQFIPGTPLDLDDPEQLRDAACLLADLHAHTSSRWGRVAHPVRRTPAEYLLHTLRDELHFYLRKTQRRFGFHFEPEDQADLWNSFERAAIELLSDVAEPFRLIHGDVHFRNFLRTDDGRFYLVDFVTVRYDLAGWEIIKGALAFSRTGYESCPLVWKAYFERAGEERWHQFQKGAGLALARCGLRELAHRRALTSLTRAEITPALLVEWLQRLIAHAPELFAGRPEETRWDELIQLLDPKRINIGGPAEPAQSPLAPSPDTRS